MTPYVVTKPQWVKPSTVKLHDLLLTDLTRANSAKQFKQKLQRHLAIRKRYRWPDEKVYSQIFVI